MYIARFVTAVGLMFFGVALSAQSHQEWTISGTDKADGFHINLRPLTPNPWFSNASGIIVSIRGARVTSVDLQGIAPGHRIGNGPEIVQNNFELPTLWWLFLRDRDEKVLVMVHSADGKRFDFDFQGHSFTFADNGAGGYTINEVVLAGVHPASVGLYTRSLLNADAMWSAVRGTPWCFNIHYVK